MEHIHMEYLPQLMENILGYLRPKIAIISTPNSDFNIYFK